MPYRRLHAAKQAARRCAARRPGVAYCVIRTSAADEPPCYDVAPEHALDTEYAWASAGRLVYTTADEPDGGA